MTMGDKMTKKIAGQIIATQTALISASNLSYGYITIKTPEKTYLKLKVDARTKYNTLEKGEHVAIEYEVLGTTDILSARKIMKKE